VSYPFVGDHTASVAVADLNGDGKVDLVLANGNCGEFDCPMGSVSVFLGNGNGSFQTAVNYSSGDFGAYSIAMADFNGDGKLDLAVSNLGPCFSLSCGSSSVGVLLGNGDGTFQNPVQYPVGADPRHVLVEDFNKDGKWDLATANGGDTQRLSAGRFHGHAWPAFLNAV